MPFYVAMEDVTLVVRDGIHRATFGRGDPVDLELLADEVRADPTGHGLLEFEDEEAADEASAAAFEDLEIRQRLGTHGTVGEYR
jgi:hypothetical protein